MTATDDDDATDTITVTISRHRRERAAGFRGHDDDLRRGGEHDIGAVVLGGGRPITDSADTTVTYSLTGTDAGRCSRSSAAGVISFRTAPDYESPGCGTGDDSNTKSTFTVNA